MEDTIIGHIRSERAELSARAVKLVTFMQSASYAELAEGHKILMRQQSRMMGEYADILTVRLALFGIYS